MKIPTAEEAVELWRVQALEAIRNGDGVEDDMLEKAFIKFAKLHVEAALKEVIKNGEIVDISPYKDGGDSSYFGVDEQSILNSYPLSNIK
jgi:hypothetical protein